MLVAQEARSLKRALLGGMSVVAFTSMLAVSGYSLAATEVDNGDTISADDATGLIESDDGAPVAIDIDATGGSITLGADGVNSLELNNGTPQNVTVTINTKSSANVTFADDVVVSNGDDLLTLDLESGTLIFEGNVTDAGGSVTVNLGDGASSVATVRIDTANAESIVLGANFDSTADGNTTSITLLNSDETLTNTITVDGTIGATNGVDSLAIGDKVTATFNGAIDARAIVVGTDQTVTFNDDVTSNIAFSNDGTIVLDNGAIIQGKTVGKTTVSSGAVNSSAAGQGTLIIKAPIDGSTVVEGDIGATNALKEVEIDTGIVTAKFGGVVNAQTFTIDGTGTAEVAGNVTGEVSFVDDATLTLADDARVIGTVVTSANGEGTLNLSTSDKTESTASNFINGQIGESGKALKLVSATAGDKSIGVFGSAIFAEDVEVDGAGSSQFFGDVTTNTLTLKNDTTAYFDGNIKIIGDVDTNGAGTGTLTFEATTTDTILVSGDVGNLKVLNVSANNGVTATFAGTVEADDTNVSGTGTIAFEDNVSGTVNFSSAATVSLAEGKTIANVDNIDTDNSLGTLSLTGSGITNVTGVIGATNEIASIVADTSKGAITFGDAVNVQNLTATGASKIISDGVGAFSASGDVTTDSGFTVGAGGLELVGEAEQTLNSAFDGAGDVTIKNTAGAVFQKAVNITGDINIDSTFNGAFEGTVAAANIDLDGTIRVEDTVTLSGNLDLGNGSIITLGNGIEDTDTVFVVNDVVSAGTTTVNLPATFTSGTIVLADSGTDASGDIANLAVTSNALVKYALQANGNDIEITATANTTAETASELGVSTDVAKALPVAVVAADTADAAGAVALNQALNAGGNTAKTAAVQVGVQADALAGTTNANIGTSQRVFTVTSDRLASLRFGGQYGETVYEGLSTGDYDDKGIGIWIRPYGNWLSQDGKSGSAGFDASTYGIAGGVDTFVDEREQYRAGLSFAASQTDVDGDGAGKSTVEIQSFQVTAYADFTGKAYFADLMAGYAYNGNDTSRVINFGGLNRTVTGSYDTHQFMVGGNAGIPFHLRGTAYLTPMVGFNYIHVMGEEYTENGGGGFSQTVDQDSLNVLIAKFDTRLHSKIRLEDAYLVPSITGGVFYDVIGDEASATASYTGGGAAFTVDGTEVEQFGGHAGFGIGYEMDGFRIGFDYDAEFKSGSIGHSARFEARVDF